MSRVQPLPSFSTRDPNRHRVLKDFVGSHRNDRSTSQVTGRQRPVGIVRLLLVAGFLFGPHAQPEAGVFQGNRLEILADAAGTSLQCSGSLPPAASAVGRIYLLHVSGSDIFIGTGSLVHRSDLVLTAQHVLASLTEDGLVHQLVFRLTLASDMGCSNRDFAFSSIMVGSDAVEAEKSGDFALVRLVERVQGIKPIALAPPSLVSAIQDGERSVTLRGFGAAARAGSARTLVESRCTPAGPSSDHIRAHERGLLIHNCSAVPGMSGAALTIRNFANQGETEYLAGIHVAEQSMWGESAVFDPIYNFNIGIALSKSMRQAILAIAAESEDHRYPLSDTL